jgi:hypothetical protein
MKRTLVLAVAVLFAVPAAGLRAMEMVEPAEHPEQAHVERAEREMREHHEEIMRRAEQLQREAKELMRNADRLQAEHAEKREPDEMRERAHRLLAEAEELRRAVKGRPETARKRVTVAALATTETPRALVLPLHQLEPDETAGIVEDLSVMARVLEKVLARELRDGFRVAAPGMPGGPFSVLLGRQSVPDMYLEGYGAVFFLRVNFPLAGAVPVPEREREEEADSLWDETRRELHGPRSTGWPVGPGGAEYGLDFDVEWPGPGRRFEPERVERLKHSVLDALRHAARIRALERGESVTVVVMGAGQPGPTVWKLGEGVYGGAESFERAAGMGMPMPARIGPVAPRRSGSNVLVIRAGKEEIDALADGKMDMDEFAEEATIILQ